MYFGRTIVNSLARITPLELVCCADMMSDLKDGDFFWGVSLVRHTGCEATVQTVTRGRGDV